MSSPIDYRVTIGIILLVLVYAFIPRSNAPEQHYHEIVTCTYANGVKSYNLVFCHTEQAQVSGDIHRHNLTAERFFLGELPNCQPYSKQ